MSARDFRALPQVPRGREDQIPVPPPPPPPPKPPRRRNLLGAIAALTVVPAAAETTPALRRFQIDWSGPIPPVSDVELTPAELQAAWAGKGPDTDLIAACNEFVQREAERRVLMDLYEDLRADDWPPGMREKYDALGADYLDRLGRITVAEATTLPGLRAKAEAMKVHYAGCLAAEWSDDDAEFGSLVDDLLRLIGGAS